MDLEILENLQNDCENKIKTALDLLIEADDIMIDIINSGFNDIDNQIYSRKIYNSIMILKQILDI